MNVLAPGPSMTFIPSSAPASAASVTTGPSGRAMAQPMDPALLEALQQHLTMERRASASYFALAIWCAERELRGFARHFSAESTGEQQHAAAFADYLIARGQTVVLEDLPAPRQQWQSLEEILSAVFLMESDVTTSLQQLDALAERSGDVRTSVFLDPVVQGQLDAENEVAHLLGRVRLSQNQPAALLILDGELAAGKPQPATLI